MPGKLSSQWTSLTGQDQVGDPMPANGVAVVHGAARGEVR